MSFKVIYALLRQVVRVLLGLVDRDGLVAELVAENRAQRQQIVVLSRTNPRPKLRRRDRMALAAL